MNIKFMTFEKFMDVVLSTSWDYLEFYTANEDSGGNYKVKDLQELFELLANGISFWKDSFTIIQMKNSEWGV
jgi:hypothetical protein